MNIMIVVSHLPLQSQLLCPGHKLVIDAGLTIIFNTVSFMTTCTRLIKVENLAETTSNLCKKVRKF